MKINEVSRTKTKTKTAEPDLSTFQRDLNDQLTGTQNVPTQQTKSKLPNLKQASAAQTQKAMAGTHIQGAEDFLDALDSLEFPDEISDEEAMARAGVAHGQAHGVAHGEVEPKPPGTAVAKIETLPAVVNKEVATTSDVVPDWHMVKHLPGYLKRAIRGLGRQVFGSFTETPIEDIQVLADLNGSGPNTKRELNAVAGWLQKNGTRDTEGEINFEKSLPGYGADFQIYTADGYTFILVKDFAGNYIYGWPSSDNIQTGHIPPHRRLR